MSIGVAAEDSLAAKATRLEATEIFTALLDRVPGIRLAGEAQWTDHQFFRALKTLPAQW